MITLAVDCMGGDHGPRVTLAACRQFLDTHSDAHLLLVGQPESLKAFAHERATVVAASEVVGMDDPVEVALRRKKDSSMRVAIQQVKDGTAAAAVSAGNTGALMAIARYLLKTLDGRDELPYFGLISQGLPRLTTITQELLIPTSDEQPHAPGVRAEVLVRDDRAIIPDLDVIEGMVVEALAA